MLQSSGGAAFAVLESAFWCIKVSVTLGVQHTHTRYTTLIDDAYLSIGVVAVDEVCIFVFNAWISFSSDEILLSSSSAVTAVIEAAEQQEQKQRQREQQLQRQQEGSMMGIVTLSSNHPNLQPSQPPSSVANSSLPSWPPRNLSRSKLVSKYAC
jgi:hypothetical protein